MTIENLEEFIKEKTEELSFGIGVEKEKLPEMDYTQQDIELLKNVTEKGELTVENNKFIATGLFAKVASDLFLQCGDDLDIEYIIEEEIDAKRIKSFSKMGSFHFMKFFDEDEWMCFKSFTDYDHNKVTFVSEFSLEEIVPETGRLTDLSDLVKFVHSKDKDLTENKGEQIKNQFRFQSGEKDGISIR